MLFLMSKHCSDTTKKHPKYGRYYDTVGASLKREGAKKVEISLFQKECINVDEMTGNLGKSVDIAFGVSSKKIKMVEMKLRVTNPKQLELKEIKDKIKFSTNALLGDNTPCLEKRTDILLSNDYLASRANKCLNEIGALIKVRSLDSFCEEYF